MNERIIKYDFIRIAAMLLVVACHCFGDTSMASTALISTLSYFEMPCNGLFFAVSGALLLPVNVSADMSVTFVFKRLKRVVLPVIIWSIIYLSCCDNLTIVSLLSIFFSAQGASIFWFMYVIIGLYIIAPILSPWLKQTDKKTLHFYLSLWMISLCYPVLKNWLNVNETHNGVLYYISGYVGFFILGYYIKTFGIRLRSTLILYIIAFFAMLVVKVYANDIKLYDGLWYLSIFCLVGVLFYWSLIETVSNLLKLTARTKSWIGTFSNLIFGVYFIHYGIINYVLPHFYFLNSFPYIVSYIIRILIVFGLSLSLSFIISSLPFGEYIVGYKNKIK